MAARAIDLEEIRRIFFEGVWSVRPDPEDPSTPEEIEVAFQHFLSEYAAAQPAPAPTVTPPSDRRATCPAERFGRPHAWTTGAFYWPLSAPTQQLYEGDDYVMCASCGQIEAD